MNDARTLLEAKFNDIHKRRRADEHQVLEIRVLALQRTTLQFQPDHFPNCH